MDDLTPDAGSLLANIYLAEQTAKVIARGEAFIAEIDATRDLVGQLLLWGDLADEELAKEWIEQATAFRRQVADMLAEWLE